MSKTGFAVHHQSKQSQQASLPLSPSSCKIHAGHWKAEEKAGLRPLGDKFAVPGMPAGICRLMTSHNGRCYGMLLVLSPVLPRRRIRRGNLQRPVSKRQPTATGVSRKRHESWLGANRAAAEGMLCLTVSCCFLVQFQVFFDRSRTGKLQMDKPQLQPGRVRVKAR